MAILFDSMIAIVSFMVAYSLVGTIILRAACALHNRVAGIPVPKPRVVQGIEIMLASLVVSLVIGGSLGVMTGLVPGDQAPKRIDQLARNVLGLRLATGTCQQSERLQVLQDLSPVSFRVLGSIFGQSEEASDCFIGDADLLSVDQCGNEISGQALQLSQA